jgi:hypothetical protein
MTSPRIGRQHSVALIAAACVLFCVLVYMDVFPGKEVDIFFGGMIITISGGALATAVLLYRVVRRRQQILVLPTWQSVGIAATILFFGLFLSATEIPSRLLFRLSYKSFQQYVNSGEAGAGVKKRIGIWKVIESEEDGRGGTFIVTSRGHDFIDTVSCGFVYKPNRQGTPFGAAHYKTWRVKGDWYAFFVTDDWY